MPLTPPWCDFRTPDPIHNPNPNPKVRLSDVLPNKRCLLLDGAACNSVSAVRACEKQSRTAEDIVVPNVCTSTYLTIQAGGLCQAYHGSARAYMDTHTEDRFGLVYLDYCCRLRAGLGQSVEKSPVCDLAALFQYRLPDPTGCVLAVCLCKEEPESRCDASQQLRHLVASNAAQHGYVAVPHWERFSYGGNFAEVFYVAQPQHIGGLLMHPEAARGVVGLGGDGGCGAEGKEPPAGHL